MGLNVFLLLTGFGVGSLIFGAALTLGFGSALAWFGVIVIIAAVIAVPLFRDEQAPRRQVGVLRTSTTTSGGAPQEAA